jgi:hypothetical protein
MQGWCLATAMPTAPQTTRALTATIVCGVLLFFIGVAGAILAVAGSVTFLIFTSSVTALCGIGIVIASAVARRKLRRDQN